jgi:hypothetical protein
MSIAEYQSDRRKATNRRETVTDELLEILTRENRGDDFPPVVLRAHFVAEACEIGALLDQIAAAGAVESDDMRRECLLAASVMLLNRLMRD